MKRGTYIFLFVLTCQHSIFCQSKTDYLVNSFEVCDLKLSFKNLDHKTGTYQYILVDELEPPTTKKDAIELRPIYNWENREIKKNITNLHYLNSKVLTTSNRLVNDTYELTFYVFVIENDLNSRNMDFHSIIEICDNYYLLSFFSILRERSKKPSAHFECIYKHLRQNDCPFDG